MRLAPLAVACGALLAASAHATAADPVMPLSDVRAGMTGEARTVVQGTEIVTFPVSVLDIQRAADSPGGALILARAEGPLMDRTGGVAQGMSGSPVYVTGADGVPRVIGAIAYGTGDQAGVIVGITPIEQMLQSASGRREFARPPASSPRRVAVPVSDRAAAVSLERRHAGRVGVYPLARWTLAGASRPVAAPLRDSLRSEGITLTTIGARTQRPAQPLVPGATMTVLLAGGDLVLGGVGTVTYVDGARVIGFGHPFLGGGRSGFLLGDGYVYQTIPAPLTGPSYKLAEPGTVQGAVVADRADGVTAVVGPHRGIPAVARAHDATRGTRSEVRAVLAPDERILPLVGGLLQTEPALRVRDGIAGGTLRLTIRIESRALRAPLVYRNTFAAYGDVISQSSSELARALAMLTQNGVSAIPVSRITVDQRIERRVRAARLVSARVVPPVVRPGQLAVLELRIAPWRSGARTLRLPYRVPAGLSPGVRSLRVQPNTASGFDPAPPALDEALDGSVAASRRRDVAAVEARAARTPGPRVRRVVAATKRQLGGRNDAVRVLLPGQDASAPSAGRVLIVDHVMTGPRVVARVRVRR
jgi:hypothetical protein